MTTVNIQTLLSSNLPVGATGISGFSGEPGFSGYSGISGFSSTSGFSGESGFSGFSGESGEQGATGPAGIEISAIEPDSTEILWCDTSEAGDAVLPVGGQTGQVLKKASNDDYDATWDDESGGGESGLSASHIYGLTTIFGS